ncbi:family 20 glycosylhydrolase [Ichthyenterobacterium sp. W332]|uniref:beta-N-acetylhexosaminidase n=1 Tax=Microcosmobacter mediterraneus TaxID=3075607 RepID=A0ABU2YIX0_9FLAO|nr:family 20 glycosylhydrolase [Ichthyenterobacterium sp. W332]MDT0557747.1 family 20 glycosylhydrolase [Ichthyenterobacterium sp. W332]
MPIKKTAALLLFVILSLGCSQKQEVLVIPQIIPKPNNQIITIDKFVLDNSTGISFPEELKISAKFLKTFIKEGSKIELKNSNEIEFILDSSLESEEGYVLDIKPNSIQIKASSDQGAFYAVQTLRQLLPSEFENGTYTADEVIIPCIEINDGPQYSYRGMHLDVGRHMYSVDFIKKYIDALAMLKMNTFHWHLTEDQGWRIEIKKYPKLQEIAAFRDETLVGHYSDQPHQLDGKRYGGYYTQEQIKDIVAYAKERFVTIIPEIEMPGHSQAAIAAYPELGCTSTGSANREQVEVATKWGVFEHIYCTKEETFKFLEDVLDEVLELFPSEYIHIGGDEAPKTNWKTCADCQSRMSSEGLKDEHELQNYFITRIEKYLNSKGRQIIGWDEILEGGLAPNATVMSWRGMNGAIEAAKQGHNVVMTPTSHCYFDYYQSENENEPTAIGGYLPLEKVYSFNPIPEELTQDESKYVLGAQGNVWTEYMPTEDQVEYMVFPRLLAMSEVVWTNQENKNYPNFVERVEQFNKRLDALDVNYANHLYEVDGQLQNENNQLSYKLSTLTEGKIIRYTSDGSEPNFNSKIYDSKIPISESSTIKAAVFKDKEQLGTVFSQDINLHKAVGAKITIDKQPHKAYSGSGLEGLINGVSGSNSRYGDKEWLGFWGEDISIEIKFEEPVDISTISTRFHNGQGQWIYAPKSVAATYYYLDQAPTVIKQIEPKGLLTEVSLNLGIDEEIKDVTKIIMWIKNYGTIPEGKQGAGNKAWTFIDEIIIN